MEPFSLDRQASAFLVVIAVMTLLMVVLSPFLLLALGGLGVVLLLVVYLKAAVRERRILAPFGAAEGALALSALLFVLGGATAGGLMFARVGWSDSFSLFRAMLPIASSPPTKGPPVGSRSVHYGDPDTNERLKQELAKAGIPFTLETRDGKEWIGWSKEHNAAADAIQERVRDAVPSGRNAFFPNEPERQKAFTDWLAKKGIKYEIVRQHGRDYVVWEEGAKDPVKQFMTEKGSADCKKKKPSC